MARMILRVLGLTVIGVGAITGIILGLGLGTFLCCCVVCTMISIAMIFGEAAPWAFAAEVLLLGILCGEYLPETVAHRNLWD